MYGAAVSVVDMEGKEMTKINKRHVILKGCLEDEMVDNGRIPIDHDVWVINKQPQPLCWDRWFQLHGLGHMLERHGKQYLRELAALSTQSGRRVYLFPEQIKRWWEFCDQWDLRDDDGGLLHQDFHPFPHEQLCHIYGNYFTGSFAWLVAFANWLGYYTDIHFAGVDLWADVRSPKPHEQWAVPCVEYHLGIAHASGIKIHCDPYKQGLMFDYWGGLYGLEAGGEY